MQFSKSSYFYIHFGLRINCPHVLKLGFSCISEVETGTMPPIPRTPLPHPPSSSQSQLSPVDSSPQQLSALYTATEFCQRAQAAPPAPSALRPQARSPRSSLYSCPANIFTGTIKKRWFKLYYLLWSWLHQIQFFLGKQIYLCLSP